VTEPEREPSRFALYDTLADIEEGMKRARARLCTPEPNMLRVLDDLARARGELDRADAIAGALAPPSATWMPQ
jgi:hypothetical protein